MAGKKGKGEEGGVGEGDSSHPPEFRRVVESLDEPTRDAMVEFASDNGLPALAALIVEVGGRSVCSRVGVRSVLDLTSFRFSLSLHESLTGKQEGAHGPVASSRRLAQRGA